MQGVWLALRVGGESFVLAIFSPQRALLCAEDVGIGSWWAPAQPRGRGVCLPGPAEGEARISGSQGGQGLGCLCWGPTWGRGEVVVRETPQYPAWRAILRS